jgi:hypothetical protein
VPLAQQLTPDGPILAIMLVDQDLSCALLEFEDFGHGIGDGRDKATALFQGSAPGNMDSDKRHNPLH